jgi:hypothetical protein
MLNTAARSLKIAIYVTIALVIGAAVVTFAIEWYRPSADRLPFYKFELGIFKVILVSFVIGMLGILIPAVAKETQQRFDQRKESRIAYSEAKTAIDYLKIGLSAASLSDAATALTRAHVLKHQAELYPNFSEWVAMRYGAKMTALTWDEMMYSRLFGARQVLEKHAEQWNKLGPAERIALLDSALPTKSEIDPPVADLPIPPRTQAQ